MVEVLTVLWYNDENNLLEANMIYKNGIKEYTLAGVMFGTPMGLIVGFMRLNLPLGIIAGFLCGFLFAFIIFIFVKFQERSFDKKRIEIAKERKIVCDGGATIDGNGGWLFFTDKGIEFYPHKINVSTNEIIISIETIKSVETNKNKIIVHTNTQKFEIVVSHNNEWKKQIEETLTSLA